MKKLNINDFPWIHQRNEVTELGVMLKSGDGESGESQLESAYVKQKLNYYEHLDADFDKF